MIMSSKIMMMILLLVLATVGSAQDFAEIELTSFDLDGKNHFSLNEIAEYWDKPLSFLMRGQLLRGYYGNQFFTLENPTVINGQILVTEDWLQEKLKVTIPREATQLRDKSLRSEEQTLKLGLKTDKRHYNVEENIAVSFLIYNPSQSAISLQFPTGQYYDLHLRKEDRIFWSWSQDKMFTQALQTITFAPGELRQFAFSISLKDIRNLEAGTYILTAVLTAGHHQITSEDIELEIIKD